MDWKEDQTYLSLLQHSETVAEAQLPYQVGRHEGEPLQDVGLASLLRLLPNPANGQISLFSHELFPLEQVGLRKRLCQQAPAFCVCSDVCHGEYAVMLGFVEFLVP